MHSHCTCLGLSLVGNPTEDKSIGRCNESHMHPQFETGQVTQRTKFFVLKSDMDFATKFVFKCVFLLLICMSISTRLDFLICKQNCSIQLLKNTQVPQTGRLGHIYFLLQSSLPLHQEVRLECQMNVKINRYIKIGEKEFFFEWHFG